MKLFFIKISLLICAVACILGIYTHYIPFILKEYLGLSTDQQIERSFGLLKKNSFECVVIGNSRAYRGVNPGMLSVPAFNFSNDGDAFNQAYYKLKYLEQEGIKIKYILLQVDYFDFGFLNNIRNFSYRNYFPKKYIEDYELASPGDFSQNSKKSFLMNYLPAGDFNEFMSVKFSTTFVYFIKKLRGIPPEKKNIPYLSEGGQYVFPLATFEGSELPCQYQLRILPIQQHYFEDILSYAKQNNIKVILFTAPMTKPQFQWFKEPDVKFYRNFFAGYIDQKNIFYLDYADNNLFTKDDFTDPVHLHKAGADKFSELLNKDILNIINTAK